MPYDIIPYATDEDVALRASADYALLCPRDQKLVYGDDGQFSSTDRWLLTSATNDFASAGVAPGNVVLLSKPVAQFRPSGELLAVAGLEPAGLRLRRKGEAVGDGQPPAPPLGLDGVEFSVGTLRPQLAAASYDLNRRYGIEELISGRKRSDLFDPAEVRDATVLTVLYRQYLEMSRGSAASGDMFGVKSQLYRQELDDLLARTVVHWLGSWGGVSPAGPTSRFGTRVCR